MRWGRRGLTTVAAGAGGLALAVGMALADVTPGPAATFRATAGEPATGIVGEFTSCTAGATSDSFGATVGWGDGTPPSTGTIAEQGTVSGACGGVAGAPRPPKRFVVTGTHTYVAAGSYSIGVVVREGRQSPVSLSGRAEVTAQPTTTTTTPTTTTPTTTTPTTTTPTTTTSTTTTPTSTAPTTTTAPAPTVTGAAPGPGPDPGPQTTGPPAPPEVLTPRVDISALDPTRPIVAGAVAFAATVDRPVKSARLQVGGRSIPLPVTCLTCGAGGAEHEEDPRAPAAPERYEVGGIDVRLPAGTTPVLHVVPLQGVPVAVRLAAVLAPQPGVRVDVTLRGVELTQGLQAERATVVGASEPASAFTRYAPGMAVPAKPGLIARRPSLLRVYPVYDRADQAPDDLTLPVLVTVRATRDGKELAPGPVNAAATAIPARLAAGRNAAADVATRRLRKHGSTVIRLPPEWTEQGTTTLSVSVKAPLGQPVCTAAACKVDDQFSGLKAKFFASPRMTVHAFGLELDDLGTYTEPEQVPFLKAPSQAEVLESVDESWKWLPVSPDALQVLYRGNLLKKAYQWHDGFELCDLLGTPAYSDNGGTLDLPLTVIQQGVWADARGCAYLGWPGAVVRGRLDLTTAHELSHNIGLDHAGCSHDEASGGGCEKNFPIPHGGLDGVPVDPATGEVQTTSSSEHGHDMMSYGSNRWISSVTADRLAQSIVVGAAKPPVPAFSAARAAAGPSGAVLVRGVIDGDVATITGVADAAPGQRGGGPARGDLELQALDASGAVLERRPLSLLPVSRHGPTGFATLMARRAGVARYAVVRGIAQLGQLAVLGGPAPTVSVPTASAKLSPRGKVAVTWKATGAGLRHALSVSGDGGRSWTGLADGLTAPRARFPASLLPSGTLRFRVAVTDGTRVATAVGRRVVAADRPPSLRVVAPVPRAVMTVGRPVALDGVATDGEDGSLRRRARWRSSRDGVIGTGAARSWTPRRAGTHTLTLTVIDARGQRATATRTVRVYPAFVRLR